MSTEQAIPILVARGSHREVGCQMGEAARDLVRGSVEYYAAGFPTLAGFDLREAGRRARPYLAAAEAFAPRWVEYLRGLADAAAVPFDDVWAVNCNEEFTCLPDLPSGPGREAARSPGPEHCTTFAFVAGDCIVAGHNEDWYPGDIEYLTVRRIELAGDGEREPVTILSVGSPVNPPFTGVTSHGLCSAANTVYTHDIGDGVPNIVILAAILECATLEEMRDLIVGAPRARSCNHLLADSGGRILDIETTASRAAVIDGGTCFAHTNHYVDPGLAAQDATTSEGTFMRRARALELIGAGLEAGADPLELAQSVLRDHADAPLSICAHWDYDDPSQDQSVTTASQVWEPAAGRLHVAAGQPCEHEFETHVL